MSNSPSSAIEIRNVSKQYHIGAMQNRPNTLRDSISASIKSLSQRNTNKDLEQTIWALKDLTFDIPQGTALGIIGHNGAGKSTLLKILSRITRPTKGHINIFGRIGSLLEVGTGFHSELSGRENIYLNGAILGMSKKTIDQKFDDIVAFAETGKFIDTPVKRFSSGMYMRLAFAVAAFLEPDILLVDEVLAVGDISFQKKCLGKMGEVANEGRTVLFVSHNLPAIASLTQSCLWLEQGKLQELGPTAEVISHYTAQVSGEMQEYHAHLKNAHRARILPREVEFYDIALGKICSQEDVYTSSAIPEGEPFTINIKFHSSIEITWLQLILIISTIDGFKIFTVILPKENKQLKPGLYSSSVTINPNYLRPGRYVCGLKLLTTVVQDEILDAISFEIGHHPAGEEDTYWNADTRGVIRVNTYQWSQVEPVDSTDI